MVVPVRGQVVRRVVGGTHHFHLHFLEYSLGGPLWLAQGVGGLFVHVAGGAGVQQLVDVKIALQFQMRPMEQGVAHGSRHGLRPFFKFFPVRSPTGDVMFRHAVGAHGAPFVVVAIKPGLCDVWKAPIVGDGLRRQMAVVIYERQRVGIVAHHGVEIGRRHARKHLAAAIDLAGEIAGVGEAEIKAWRQPVLTAETPQETLAQLQRAYDSFQARSAGLSWKAAA